MGKDSSAMMAGLLMRRFHNAYLDELKAVREALGEDWVKIRRNRNGRSERYYPVLDGLYKLTREMDECGEALINGTEDGRLKTEGSWPGECSFPGMQDVFWQAMGELDQPETYDKPGAQDAEVKGFWGRLGRMLGLVDEEVRDG